MKFDWTAIIVENGKLSVGRLMLWTTFITMMVFWIAQIDVAESMMTAFLTFVAYNFGKKVRDVASEYVTNSNAKKLLGRGEDE